MSTKVELNPLGMKKKDFIVEEGVVTAVEGLWDQYLSKRLSAEQAEMYLEVESEYAASVTKVSGDIAIKLMKGDNNLDKVRYRADLPGEDSVVRGTVYRERSFGSELAKSKTVHYGYTDTTIRHGHGEETYHVQDYIAKMAKKAFEDSKK